MSLKIAEKGVIVAPSDFFIEVSEITNTAGEVLNIEDAQFCFEFFGENIYQKLAHGRSYYCPSDVYRISYDGSQRLNNVVKDGKLLLVFENYKFSNGALYYKQIESKVNANFPDGKQQMVTIMMLEVEIISTGENLGSNTMQGLLTINSSQVNSVNGMQGDVVVGAEQVGAIPISEKAKLATVEQLNTKVDKIYGKGLSENDYTSAEKQKLAGLSNFDPSSIENKLAAKVDKEEGSSLIKLTLIDKLAGIESKAQANVIEGATLGGEAIAVSDKKLQLDSPLEQAKLKLFIDLWNTACNKYGGYNTSTGKFELNGFEFDYDTALEHYTFANGSAGYYNGFMYGQRNLITNIPTSHAPSIISYACIFGSSIYLQKLVWGGEYMMLSSYCFFNCPNLQEIEHGRWFEGSTAAGCFIGLPKLEKFKFTHLKRSTSFSQSPLFSYDSIYFIIDNCDNITSTITFTLHSSAAENARAQYLLAPVAGFATLDLWAASKNISIATA